jgi:hypothetical protein
MPLSYYRCDWTHPPNEDPIAIFYEVDGEGQVLRLIDLFADGRRACESVTDFPVREGDLRGVDSLVEGSFFAAMAQLIQGHVAVDGDDRLSLTVVEAQQFEAEWRSQGWEGSVI